MRRRGIQVHRAAGEARRVVAAERQVGVGDRGLGAAAAVARRAGIGTSALRSHRDAAHRIDMRDRAAAGTDLHHLDYGNPQRQTGAFAEPSDASDLEGACGLRSAVVDQADLRGGAAHVE